MKTRLLTVATFLFLITGNLFGGNNNVIFNDDEHIVTFIKNRQQMPHMPYQYGLSLQPAWQDFVAKNPGWMVWFNENNQKPHRATGKPIKTGVFGKPEFVAYSFLSNYLNSFNIPVEQLQLQNVAANSKYYYVNFRQYSQNIEVLWSNATVKLTKNMEVMLFGLDVYNDINKLNHTPSINIAQASDFATSSLQGVTYVSAPALKILPVPADRANEYHLVYELTVSGNSGKLPYQYYTLVDAHTGEIMYRQNKIVSIANTDVNISATVYPTNPTLPTAVMPVKYVQVDVAGLGIQNTDNNGYLGLSNTTAVSATITLQGPWAKAETNGITPAFSATFNPGANAISFDPNASIRELSAYNFVNDIHDYYKLITLTTTANNVMDFQIRTIVDIADSCNAFYDGNLNFFDDSPVTCQATSIINDVVYHEYGHGINFDLYNFYGGNFTNGALGEGYADTWANGLTEDPILGTGFYKNNPAGYVRRYDIGKKIYPQDLIGEVHADGEIIAGAWWDVGLNMNDMQARQALFFETFAATLDAPSGSEGQLYHDILIEALTDDDNDGNLANGTPHICEITGAFAIHGITVSGVSSSLIHAPVTESPAFAQITLAATANSLPPGGTVNAYYRINQGTSWTFIPMNNIGGNNFSITIPGVGPNNIIHYYIDITDSCGTHYNTLPFMANDTNPNLPYNILVGYTQQDIQDFDNFMGSWTITLPTDNNVTGDWEVDAPIESYVGTAMVQPNYQVTAGGLACAFTGNAPQGSGAGTNDVDGGLTTLLSPVYDLTAYTNPAFSYYRWYSNDQGATPGTDYWQVSISNDNGNTWVPVEYTNVSDHSWRRVALRVSDYVTPTSQTMIRFIGEDAGPGSLVEGLMDDLVLWDLDPNSINDNVVNELPASVYPNPASNQINLNWTLLNASNVSILISDELGNVVYSTTLISKSGKNIFQVNTSKFEQGIYLIKIVSDTAVHNEKISIVRN